MTSADKEALLAVLRTRLAAEVEAMTRAAMATHAEATDDENRAEDKYDTRGLEASYLAHGQSRAAEEAAEALAQFRALPARVFGNGDPVGLGAVVTLEVAGRPSTYFIGPRAGGTEVVHAGVEILVVTPQSPLGRQLVGRRAGDQFPLEVGGRRSTARITQVA